MGRLSLGNKTSPIRDQAIPPPPYHDATQSSLIVAETTTTRTQVVTTTTETTTHFLSFPGWRKRNNVTYTSTQDPRHSGNIEDNKGPAANTTLSQREKALPPTPPEPPATTTSLESRNRKLQITAPDMYEDTLNSTTALPQTSLGLGVPHTIPHTSTSSSSASEVNTVAFLPSFPSQPNADSIPVLRRSKSSQRMDKPLSVGSSEIEALNETHRRTRGVSLGPTSFLGFNGTSAKGKEKLADPPKSLSRKSSFWTRKKPQNLSTQARPATAHGDVFQQHPVVEVNLSDPPLPPPRRQKLQARDPVSRSFSERPQSYYPTIRPEISTSPTADCLTPTSRPSTAENPNISATGRLTSGLVRTAAVSFSAAPTGERQPIPRVRSQTNPPLLHRLSLNVFSSSVFLSASPTSSPNSPLLSTTSDPLGFRDQPKPVIIPRPMENEESPEFYVRRLMQAVSKVEVTSILASR